VNQHIVGGMIETTIPEINVADLMEQVRAKVAASQKENARGPRTAAVRNSAILSPEAIAPPPPLALPQPALPRKERVLALVDRARTAIDVKKWVPKPLRRFFRKQGGYNRPVLESISMLAKANGELSSRIEQLTACVEVQHAWLRQSHARSRDNLVSANRQVDVLVNRIERFSEDLQPQLDAAAARSAENVSNLRQEVVHNNEILQQSHEDLLQELKKLRSSSEDAEKRVRELQQEVERRTAGELALQKSQEELVKTFTSVRGDAERSAEHLRNLQREFDSQVAAVLALQKSHDDPSAPAHAQLNESLAELWRGFQLLRTDGEHAGEHLRNLQTAMTRSEMSTATARQRLDWLETRQAELTRTSDRLDERLTAETAFLRAHLSSQSSVVQRAIASTSKSAVPNLIAEPSSEAPNARFDAFYMRFEDRFRGSRDEIKERISFYLPCVWESNAGLPGHPILDLGCGRGEWLELLRDIGMEARGVDINAVMLSLCRQRGLEVIQSDALEYLRSLPDNSHGAVTGFHIIEHLPFEMLMDMFSEVHRVVEPGGFVIFESPNCKNLLVGACNFNVDPTHRNPVFPDTAKFILDTLGFYPVRLEYLTPVPGPGDATEDVHPVLKDLLYGPQDFAVIGYKAVAT
jgi:O-antigen chain-terminating methyltransferase